MAYEKDYDVQEPVQHANCIHLRSKAIYVTGELRNTGHPDEEGSQYCWCNLTQHILGPDEKDVAHRACGPDRDCYRESY